ncbi:transmembrane protein, putative (macronuclear) [Tetrahymena thermophila SB210]|uniref:Transmembrane protein, putative n=1 Tax=Tetrahymena thermophila (strain SB210) TaxID=312017 RepID=I7MDJ9_TETTS|nr:transmembrane protein, putative [Tetrahymena thermophila SB210]EAR89270.2 transmembrane protein, putative [Tetrahymena thermophila SB210]|eukprot:XP_001009515.2 transmembrane protein, putative [Tetrahymena thermophila SB210]
MRYQETQTQKLFKLIVLIDTCIRLIQYVNSSNFEKDKINLASQDNNCAISSSSTQQNVCTIVGGIGTCTDKELMTIISDNCQAINNLSLINFTVDCSSQSQNNILQFFLPNTQNSYNTIALQQIEFFECQKILIKTNQAATIKNIIVSFSNTENVLYQQFLETERQRAKKQNLTNDVLYNDATKNSYKSKNQTDHMQNRKINRQNINSYLNQDELNFEYVYTMVEPQSSLVIQSNQIYVDTSVQSDSQVLIIGYDIFIYENTVINANQFGIYRQATTPPQTNPLLLKNVQINTLYINCLNSLEEAKKKMQYQSFFQINFSSNSSYIEVPNFDNNIQLYKYLLEVLNNNYTTLIVTQTDSTLSSSSILTSKLGYFANNIVIDSKSVVSSTGLGCPSDYGLGKGVIFGSNPNLGCRPSGAHHVSYGGIGLPDFSGMQDLIKAKLIAQQCLNNTQVAQFVSESFPYDSTHITEGSGGGNNLDPTYFNYYTDLSGAGGGLIFIGAAQNLRLDGEVESNGKEGGKQSQIYYGGGGSGGSIKIIANNFIGSGSIKAKGGNSPDGLSGEGAGGIIDINILNDYSLLTDKVFNGNIDVTKGNRDMNFLVFQGEESIDPSLFLAQNGTLVTPFCPQGYTYKQNVIRCVQCGKDQFKTNPYGQCTMCPKYDINSIDDFDDPEVGQGEYCQLNCDQIVCDPFGFYIKIVGPYGMIFIQVTLSLLTTGYVIRRIYRLKKGKIDHLPFDFEEATEFMRIDDQIITTDLSSSPDFILSDLLFHTHRIYVLGTNSLNNYWKLTKFPPPEVEYIINREQYRKFAERFNQTVKWKLIDKILLVILSFVYYPLYWSYLTRVRKGIYKKARKFFQQNELKIINMNISGQFDKVQIKFSKSIDYTLCYFDIFDYKKSNFKYFFLNIPYFISLSGDGSFIKPLNVNENDVFCKCLYFSINRNRKKEIVNERQRVMENLVNHKLRIDNSKKLNKFIKKFNRYTRSIDFMAPISSIQMSLQQIVELLKKWNQYFFNPNNVGCDLVVFEVPKKEGFKQIVTVLENLEKESFNEFIAKIINTIRNYNNFYEVNMKLFIYNLDSPLEEVAQTMDDQRITIATEGNILHQTVKESVLSSDFITIKEKFQRKEIQQIRESSIHSRFSFVDDHEIQSTKIEEQAIRSKVYNHIKRVAVFIRFCLFTHSPTNLGKHVLIFVLTTLIVIDSILTIPTIFNIIYAIQALKSGKQYLINDLIFLFLPYPLAVWISPILGLLLVTSQSYGIAKMYVIYNSMSLIDLFLNIIYTVQESTPPSMLPEVYILKIATFLLRVVILYFASKYLSTSTKLTHLNTQKRV